MAAASCYDLENITCQEVDDCLADAEISGYVDELLGLGVIAEPEQVIRCIEGNCRHGPFCLSSWDDICAAFGAEAKFWCEYLNEEDGIDIYLVLLGLGAAVFAVRLALEKSIPWGLRLSLLAVGIASGVALLGSRPSFLSAGAG